MIEVCFDLTVEGFWLRNAGVVTADPAFDLPEYPSWRVLGGSIRFTALHFGLSISCYIILSNPPW